MGAALAGDGDLGRARSPIRPISASRPTSCRWIYDITTDPIDPPRYEALARVRPRDANPVAYAGLYAAEQQREAYPDIGPLGTVNATPQAAYDAAFAVINKRKWRVVDARAPQAARREGRIEAVARTPIMGFRDDVVVRIRAEADGARIDVRSSSRYGSVRFRHQCRAHPRPDERDRRRDRAQKPRAPPSRSRRPRKARRPPRSQKDQRKR